MNILQAQEIVDSKRELYSDAEYLALSNALKANYEKEVPSAPNAEPEKQPSAPLAPAVPPAPTKSALDEKKLNRIVDRINNTNILSSLMKERSYDVALLFLKEREVNVAHDDGAVLRMALDDDCVDIVKHLITVDKRCCSPAVLEWACKKGYENFVEFLLQKGVIPTIRALQWVCRVGSADLVELLLRTNSNRLVEAEKRVYGTNDSCYCLYVASGRKASKMVELLLQAGFYDWNHNALSESCSSGHIEIVKLLLNNKNKFRYSQDVLDEVYRETKNHDVRVLLKKAGAKDACVIC